MRPARGARRASRRPPAGTRRPRSRGMRSPRPVSPTCTSRAGAAADPAAAAIWYRKAAEAGLAQVKMDAQYRLGTLYEQGRGVERNSAEAVSSYLSAAALGHAAALMRLRTLCLAYAVGGEVA